MRLGIILLLLSCAVSPVLLTSPLPSNIQQCTGATFLPVACNDDLVVEVFAGTDGAQGKSGKIGLRGPRGEKGENAVLCNNKNTKVKCASTYVDLLKIRGEIRWMDAIMHILLGYDIGDLTKVEMIKLILIQNTKIIQDTSVIEVLDGRVDKLTKEIEKVSDKKNYQNDESYKPTDKNEDKEVNALKKQVAELQKQLKVSGKTVEELTKAKDRMKEIEDQLKTKSNQLTQNIAVLEKGITAKKDENRDLLKKLQIATSAANNNANAFKTMVTQNENLKKERAEADIKCKKTILEKEAELERMKIELAALKLHCKDVDNQKSIIAELKKQIQELNTAKVVIEPPVQPAPLLPREMPIQPRTTPVEAPVYGTSKPNKVITSIAGEDVGHFADHLHSGKILLQSQMGNDGSGPYIIVLRRLDGSQDFRKSFAEYQKGFGNSQEFWLGLDILHDLTKRGNYELKVKLTDHKGKKFFARYRKFSVGPAPGYRLTVGDFTGNTYNALKYHNNQKFSTFDNDQDATSTRSCAEGTGGWWFKRCQLALLTGTYHQETMDDKTGIRWYDKKVHSRYYSWKKAVMMIKPA